MLRTIVPGLTPRTRVRGEALERARARQGAVRVARAPRPARESRRGEDRLSSNASFTRSQPGPAGTLLRPMPVSLGISFLITAVWFVLNVQRPSPLDVLPFAWTWLTLWLATSVVVELWRRYAGSGPARRPRA